MNRILFIGGAGFIGSSLIHRFINDPKYTIFVYEPLFADMTRLSDISNKITVIRGTLTEFDLVCSTLEIYEIDIVVHLVSTLIPGSSYKDYINEFKNVIFPTVELMSYCAKSNIKFIYFSSGGTVYGNGYGGKFVETDKLSPISFYGLSKQILEDSVLFEHRRKKLRYLIIRPSNLYGHGQNIHGNQGFIAVALGKILSKKSIEIWGNGSSIRDYIYIDDLAEALFLIVDKKIENETFNIGSGKGYSIKDILIILEDVVNELVNVVYKDGRPVDVDAMVLDITKLEDNIAFHHTHLKEGIGLFYEYVKRKIEK